MAQQTAVEKGREVHKAELVMRKLEKSRRRSIKLD